MLYGIRAGVWQKMRPVFQKYPTVQRVILYGSRAKGNFREGSDIDMVLEGDVSQSECFRIENDLDDLLLPWKIDLSVRSKISNQDLQEHISRVGKVVYEREMQASVISSQP